MKKNLFKILTLMLTMTVVISLCITTASAYTPYTSYNYDFYGDIVYGPSGYIPEKVLFGSDILADLDISEKEFVNPSAMCIAEDGRIFLVDSGADGAASRVIILNKDFKAIKVISEFIGTNGQKLNVINATDVCLDKSGYIYLCDPDSFRVLKMDTNGKVVLTFGAPPSEFVKESFVYRPQKASIGINGSMYVISKGCTDGIMEFDTKGSFVRFFGAPEVALSVSDYINIYWRNIYRIFGGDSVDDYFATYVPSEFVNLTVDENGFVFTMEANNESSTEELYKLNFIGSNILDPNEKSTKKRTKALSSNYGDLITRTTVGQGNIFADVCTDDDGFFTLLDGNYGRMFEYDREGNLIFVYGGRGNELNQIQNGLLANAVAIGKIGSKTVVLDSVTGAITIFKLSDFGTELHKAVNYYNRGEYEAAKEPWNNVLKYDSNSELAHIGLGKVYYLQGDYKEALAEFKLGNDRNNYSRTYKLYRDDVIRANFTWVVSVVILLLILLFVWKKFGKKIIQMIKKDGGEQ